MTRTRLFLDSPELSDAIYHFKNYARECDRLCGLINETGFVATFHLMGIRLCFSAEREVAEVRFQVLTALAMAA